MSDPCARANEPVTLAEQMFAWGAWCEGEAVNEIALVLRRRVTQVRVMLFGKP